ncbi:hypothetical protein GS896_27675 [Rhodococcus hoagii]|nr:hypothetical protein [Prescottella equi]MBM4654033.1 hypothetical protein [Prescottella equi]MBM4719704.1 hypothetical protein [Prescottella equi]NKR23501.1 hypothetical protein [Prescottella equi]NKT56345.1 hypothetical protein [Prescottella equi]
MADTLNFDQWNRETTRRICANEDPTTARAIRAARSDSFARVSLWDDYLATCAAENRTPEKQF